jgi:hypothetical protein
MFGMTDWLTLSARDRDILFTLTHRVRCLSVEQVGRTWWSTAKTPTKDAARRLTVLAKEGLIERFATLARPELELAEPVCNWSPDSPRPDFGKIAYLLKTRWRDAQPRRTSLVIATRQAVLLLGGQGDRRPRASETTHDLHLAAIYLRLVAAEDKRAKRWVSEAALYSQGWGRNARLPDAMILAKRGPHTVVEFAGEYSKRKLIEFHDEFSNRGLCYELW